MKTELYKATRSLKLTAENQVVEADQADGRFKLVDAGGYLTPQQAAEFGLTEDMAEDFGLEPVGRHEAHPQSGSHTVVSPHGAPAVGFIGLGAQAVRPAPRRSGLSAREDSGEEAAETGSAPHPSAAYSGVPSPTVDDAGGLAAADTTGGDMSKAGTAAPSAAGAPGAPVPSVASVTSQQGAASPAQGGSPAAPRPAVAAGAQAKTTSPAARTGAAAKETVKGDKAK